MKSHIKIGSMVEGINTCEPDRVIDIKAVYDPDAPAPHSRNRRDAVGLFVYVKLENDYPRTWRNIQDFWNVKDE